MIANWKSIPTKLINMKSFGQTVAPILDCKRQIQPPKQIWYECGPADDFLVRMPSFRKHTRHPGNLESPIKFPCGKSDFLISDDVMSPGTLDSTLRAGLTGSAYPFFLKLQAETFREMQHHSNQIPTEIFRSQS